MVAARRTRLTYGPYRDAGEARHCLTAFADSVSVQRLGILWSTGNDATWLRQPIYDGAGFGLSLLVRYETVPVIPPSSFERMVERLDHFLGGALTRMGQTEMDNARMQMEASRQGAAWLQRNVITPVNDFIGRHEAAKDGIAVALDVSAVIAGGVAAVGLLAGASTVAIGVGLALGVLAGVAGLALLWQDAKHLWFVLNGDDAGKLSLEADPKYQWIEAVAPLVALPDLAMSGRAAVRELMSAGSQAGRAARLTQNAARVAAAQANEYRQVMADAEQSARILAAARQQVEFRAAQYRRLQAITKRINHDLIVKGNSALAYGGTTYGTGMYALQPPELAKRLTEGGGGGAGAAHGPYQLLAPAALNGAPGNMQVTAVVANRRGCSR